MHLSFGMKFQTRLHIGKPTCAPKKGNTRTLPKRDECMDAARHPVHSLLFWVGDALTFSSLYLLHGKGKVQLLNYFPVHYPDSWYKSWKRV